MADTSDFRRGMVIELNGTLYSITYFQHVKPGKGGAFVRTKLKDVMEGGVVDKTFRAGEKVKEVRLERRPIQYTYTDGQLYYFMNMETYEQIPLSGEQIGEDQLQYLQENMECQGLNRDGVVLSVELPQFVELEIVETEPGLRGDTAQGGAKRAQLAPGAVVQVPLFLEVGDVVRVDRTEGKYVTRVT
ncbi:elongation factor P [Candidatus Palauibacter sp.]|uniref:elongation factor P n=1 Tax=Candidatus Palauibacter sp. TaxID=3101350 RepID=UPI003B51A2AB